MNKGDSMELDLWLPATPQQVFHAWVDGPTHAQVTGGDATSDPRVGGQFTAWDGYIEGTYLELAEPHLIVQHWRTSEFPEGAPDSRLEIALSEENGGTRLVLRHSAIPEGDGPRYQLGWVDSYFKPLSEFFAGEHGA